MINESCDFIVIEKWFDSAVIQSIKTVSKDKPLFLSLPYIEIDDSTEKIIDLYHEGILDGLIIDEAHHDQENDY